MLKIVKNRWDANREKLRTALTEGTQFNSCDYKDLVKLAFATIFNPDDKIDVKNIVEIDQGTLIYMIPFDTYQPSECEYLMTYVGYGTCSGCDTLQAIQNWKDEPLNESQISDFMGLCKDILTSTIKPYNYGWRHTPEYDTVEESKGEEQ